MKAFRIPLLCCLFAVPAGCTTSGIDAATVLALQPAEATAAAPTTGSGIPEGINPLAAESTPPEPDAAEAAPVPPQKPGDAAPGEAAPVQVAALAPEKPVAAALAAAKAEPAIFATPEQPRGISRTELDRLIAQYAVAYEVPETLVRRVVKRESNFYPGAYNKGHWGLMQIKHATARGMGYSGPANGLLDAETNLKYAVRYLRGAWLVAGGDHDRAVRLYARGYYYDAKRAGLLDETGLGKDRRRRGG